jgi:hypothetical protein
MTPCGRVSLSSGQRHLVRLLIHRQALDRASFHSEDDTECHKNVGTSVPIDHST